MRGVAGNPAEGVAETAKRLERGGDFPLFFNCVKIFSLYFKSVCSTPGVDERSKKWQKKKLWLIHTHVLWTKSSRFVRDAVLYIRLQRFMEARLVHGITARSVLISNAIFRTHGGRK